MLPAIEERFESCLSLGIGFFLGVRKWNMLRKLRFALTRSLLSSPGCSVISLLLSLYFRVLCKSCTSDAVASSPDTSAWGEEDRAMSDSTGLEDWVEREGDRVSCLVVDNKGLVSLRTMAA